MTGLISRHDWRKKRSRVPYFGRSPLAEALIVLHIFFSFLSALFGLGQVYSFTGGRVKVANKKFSSLNAEYEITFDSNCQIIFINDDNRIGNMT